MTTWVHTATEGVRCCAQSDKLNQYYGSTRGKWLGTSTRVSAWVPETGVHCATGQIV